MAERETRRTLVLAKLHATPGVDPVPTASANVIQVHEASGIVLDQDVQEVTGDFFRESLTPGKILIGRALNRIILQVWLQGSGIGTPLTAPFWDALIKGCGFTRTDTADATHRTHAYTPISTGFPLVAFYIYMDGLLYKAFDGRGSFALNMEAGNRPLLTFDYDATFVEPIEAALPAATMPPHTCTMVESEGLTLGTMGSAQGLVPVSLDIDWGLRRRFKKDMNKEYGFGGIGVRKREPSGNLRIAAIDDLDGAGVVNLYQYVRSAQRLPDGSMHDITLNHKSSQVDPQTQIKPSIFKPQPRWPKQVDDEGGTYYDVPLHFRHLTAEGEFKLEVIEKLGA